MAVNKFGQSDVGYGIDKFGRSQPRREVVGFKLTADDNYDILGKRLTNIGDPKHESDATNKKFIIKHQQRFEDVISDHVSRNQQRLETFIVDQTQLIEKRLKTDFVDFRLKLANVTAQLEAMKNNFEQDLQVTKIVNEREIKNQISDVTKKMNLMEERINEKIIVEINVRVTDLERLLRARTASKHE